MKKFLDENRALVFIGIWLILSLILIECVPMQPGGIRLIAEMAGFSLATAFIPAILLFALIYSPYFRFVVLVVILVIILGFGIQGYILLWSQQ